MKRVQFVTILLLLLGIFRAQAQDKTQDKIYVYLNDGNIESFFQEEVDSITYSHIDTAGIVHEDYVAQLIHQSDTVFQMPLASIDSVSFVDPPIEYTEDVVQLTDDFWLYVKEIKGKTIYALADLPTSFVPEKGQILVYPSNNVSQYTGFSGTVEEVVKGNNGSYEITVSIPSLTDIFKNLIIAEKIDLVSGLRSGLPPFSFEDLGGIHGEIKINEFDPNVSEINTRIDNKVVKGFRFSLRYSYMLNFGVQKKISTEKVIKPIPIPFLCRTFPIPQSSYLVAAKIGCYLVPAASGRIDFNYTYNPTYFLGGELKDGVIRTGVRGNDGMENFSTQMDLDGSLYFGVRVQLGIGTSFWKDTFGIEGNIGMQMAGNISLKTPPVETASLYKNLKDAKLEFGFPWDIGLDIPNGVIISLGGKDTTLIALPKKTGYIGEPKELYIVPNFTQPEITSLDEYYRNVQVTSTASRRLLFPCKIALALSKGDQFLKYGDSQEYKSMFDSQKTLTAQFTELEEDTEYNITPCISLFDHTFQTDISTRFKTEGEEKPDPKPQPSLLIGKWILHEDVGIETFVYEFDEQGHFTWTIYDPEAEGGIDVDSTYGTYEYNDSTHILTMHDAKSGESASIKIQLTIDTLILFFGDNNEIYQRCE